MDAVNVEQAISAYALNKRREYNRQQYRKRLADGYYEENKERIRSQHKKHYEKNKAVYIARAREWNDKHPELKKKYYKAHRQERIQSSKAWQMANAEKYREYQKQYRNRKKMERSGQYEHQNISQSPE